LRLISLASHARKPHKYREESGVHSSTISHEREVMTTRRTIVLLAILMGLAGAASAQEYPKAEISLGYSYLYDDSFKDTGVSGSFPLGWMASVNLNVNSWLGVVADVSGSYKSEDTAMGVDLDNGLDFNLYGFHGGFRISGHKNQSATPYVQALAGVARGSVGTSVVGVGVAVSETDFSFQPGLGVIVRLSDSIGIDLGGDYRMVFAEGVTTNEFRAHAGIVFRIGR
jgi:opacity protein-like surface antigen